MRTLSLTASAVLVLLVTAMPIRSAPSIVIGLDADMSSGSARSGEAIRRGIVLAIEEINRSGGLLGRQLKLVVKDHRGNPARGIDNLAAFGKMQNLAAVVGGLHTPVVMAELPHIHQYRLVFLVPWAAGAAITDNGYSPNFVFRLSVNDSLAGPFLVDEAARRGHRRFGLLLEQTAWGRSNYQSIKSALGVRGLHLANLQWFHWGVSTLADKVSALEAAGADAILLVANAPEGATAIEALADLPPHRRLPVYAHWGITGGRFFDAARENIAKVDLYFLQTFSFLDPPFPARAEHMFQLYQKSFPGVQSQTDVFAPAGTAHAYDLIHLLAQAVAKAGTIERAAVRRTLETLPPMQGLLKHYATPFASGHHDALGMEDFRLARYDRQGAIVPMGKPRAER